MSLLLMLLGLAAFLGLLAMQASLGVLTLSSALVVLLIIQLISPPFFVQIILFTGLASLIIGLIKPIRAHLLSAFLLRFLYQRMPKMSQTEREALEAGTVSWEGDLFSGAPDFDILHKFPHKPLTAEEREFIEGPVNQLCRMINDWEMTHKLTDMPGEVWQFIKDKGFLGMIIPKEYEGLGFSANAQVQILSRIYSRSVTVGTTIAVPNSLGPGELLLKYGTDEQKKYYLPRLAKGLEIPCFALTGATAGSDAASIPDKGIVCQEVINGESVVGIRLNWDKRYITLCPIATVIGLAFRLFDPQNLLGTKVDLGISCALIPASTPGVIRGRRHFPLNTAFLNGPTQGKDVFIPLDYLIGGAKMAGAGWKMLMECLSAGRAISLPSSAAGGSQAAALATGAYARIRKQFKQPIANFEGIEEPLARIAGNTYIIEAGLRLAVMAIDHGAKPAVAGAILKYHTTERARQIALDAMDVHGGKGICLGPRNYLGRGYQNSPISITVEGANILTRSLIIFGQGAIRCHPFVYKEMQAIQSKNLQAFDTYFWQHTAFFISNSIRSSILALTNARFVIAPQPGNRNYQLIHRYSCHLAFLADFCMIFLGSKLKRKEKISARLGDILSHLYLASAVLKRFYDEGQPPADLPVVEWACKELLHECDLAIQAIIVNFPNWWGRLILRIMVQPFGIKQFSPSDNLGKQLAKLLSTNNDTRERITSHAFREASQNCPLGYLEETFQTACKLSLTEQKLTQAIKKGLIEGLRYDEQINEAEQKNILSEQEARDLRALDQSIQEVIAVDDFDDTELRRAPHFKNSLGQETKKEKLIIA